ncbi:MAG: ribosomal protein L7/L12 [Sebaldella sp.]|nr:ribosomal protein L7/L12 [Sebaldella sp.]
MDLKEAKEMVEGVKIPEEAFKDINKVNESDLLASLLSSNIPKIAKIKKVRELTGLGLKEAKDLVEGQ